MERKIDFWIRNILRLMAWVVLLFYMIFRILMPIMDNERVVLDQNDGWVIFSCMCLLLVIEGVRAVLKSRLNKLSGKNSIKAKAENDENKDGGGVIPGKGF